MPLQAAISSGVLRRSIEIIASTAQCRT